MKSDIIELRTILEQGIFDNYSTNEMFHIAIAKATKNSILESLLNDLLQKRYTSKMWDQLHSRITDHSCRKKWLYDHERILQALHR